MSRADDEITSLQPGCPAIIGLRGGYATFSSYTVKNDREDNLQPSTNGSPEFQIGEDNDHRQ